MTTPPAAGGRGRCTETEIARMLASSSASPLAERFESERREWIRKQLEVCPPMSDRQRAVVRTAFAAHRTEQAGAA